MKHLVCVNDKWVRDPSTPAGPAPKKGDIVEMLSPSDKKHFIILCDPYRFDFTGNEQWFHENCFREVDSSFGQYCEDVYLSIAQFEEAMKEMAI